MSWYLKGETGKTLGPERQAIGALKIRGARVVMESLSPDVLTWSAKSGDLAGGGTVIPDAGQKVSLYWDEQRVFHGHVERPKIKLYEVEVEAQGAWAWLRREEVLSDDTDGGGFTSERPALKFASGNVATHLASLIGLARSRYSIPIREGTISAGYDIPTVSFSLTSLADAFAKLLESMPDGVLWMDHAAEHGEAQGATSTTLTLAAGASAADDFYNGQEVEMRSGAAAGETRVISDYNGATRVVTLSAAWSTTPAAGDDYTLEVPAAVNVTRRADAPETTYTIGEDLVMEPFEFYPRPELAVTRVELPYVSRAATTGLPLYQKQVAGTETLGKTARVTISGKELADFLPFDDFDSITIDQPTVLELLTDANARLAAYVVTYGTGNISLSGSVSSISSWTSQGFTSTVWSWSMDAPPPASHLRVRCRRGGVRVPPPDWLVAKLGLKATTASGSYMIFVDSANFGTAEADAALAAAGQSGFYAGGDYYALADVTDMEFFYAPTANLPGGFTGADFTEYKPWDFDYLAPPATLAADLLAAASWTPWEGQLTLRAAAPPATNPLGARYHVAGTLPAAATAGALLRGWSLDLETRKLTLKAGVPPRNDFRTLVGRQRRNPQDNIVEL